MMEDYSIWVLEYSHVLEYPKSGVIYGAHNEGHLPLPYCYAVIKGNGRTIMVDVGYNFAEYGQELAERYQVIDWQSPQTVLAEIGLRPEDIDMVLVTHAHFDHFGNVDAFPKATFYLQERELSKWLWALSLPKRFHFYRTATDPGDIMRAVKLADEGRLVLLDGDVENLFPGISVHAAYDTHTFGSMWVDVRNNDDPEDTYVLAGDNVYVYENVEGVNGNGVMQPVGVAVNHVNVLNTMSEMLDTVTNSKHIIPIHDYRLPTMFPSRKAKYGLDVTEVRLGSNEVSKVKNDYNIVI